MIDTKSSRGQVRVQRVGGLLSPRRELLLIGRRDCTHLLDGLERQLASVHSALCELALGELGLCGALCFPFAEGLPKTRQLHVREGTIAIAAARGVAKLVRRSRPLGASEIAGIAAQLAERFPAA